jgi:hypothetical protein
MPANVIIARVVPKVKPRYRSSVIPVKDFHVSISFECNMKRKVRAKNP